MDREHYEYCKKELLHRKTHPYKFANETLAKEFFEIFKHEVPTARYYEIEGVGQFITHDRRAENRLCQHIDYLIGEHQKELLKLADVMMQVEDSMRTNETRLEK